MKIAITEETQAWRNIALGHRHTAAKSPAQSANREHYLKAAEFYERLIARTLGISVALVTAEIMEDAAR